MSAAPREKATLALIPFDAREAMSIAEAARQAGVSASSIREWVERYGIGRKVVGRVKVSRAALLMLQEDDLKALESYCTGDRSSREVRDYLTRAGLADLFSD